MLGAEDAFGLDRRAVVILLGLGELTLVAGHVPLVAERGDDVGVVRAPRALDAVGVVVGHSLGFVEPAAFAEEPAEEVDGAERVGVFRLEHTAAVGHVLPQHGLGLVQLAQVPQHGAESFGGVEGEGVVETEEAAGVVEIAAEQRLGLGGSGRPVEERGQQVGGAERAAAPRPLGLRVEADRLAEVFLRPIVFAQREIGPADRLAEPGLDVGLAADPAADIGRGIVEQSRTVLFLPSGSCSASAWASRRRLTSSTSALGRGAIVLGLAPLPGRRPQTRRPGPTRGASPPVASAGLRRHHIAARTAGPTGRARIGSPFCQRVRSSASA